MSKRNIVFMAALFALSAVLVGCGGGGGSVNIEDGKKPPVVTAGRNITGIVVSSATGNGAGGVIVRFSQDLSAVTKPDGKFSIALPVNTALPVTFRIDTGPVSNIYPTNNIVKYNGQSFMPDNIYVPVNVLNGATDDLGVVTVYDATGDAAPPPPYISQNTVLVGRVVNGATGLGVAGVSVKLGITPEPVYPTTTGKYGYFAIDFGLGTSLLSIYPGANAKFVVTLGDAASLFPATAVLSYRSFTYIPGAVIPVTPEVMAGETNNMGVIEILASGSGSGGGSDTGGGPGNGGGPDLPPPPPILP